MPVAPGNPLDGGLESLSAIRRIRNTEINEVQTNSTHTRACKRVEFRLRSVTVDQRDAPRALTQLPKRIEHARIVIAVDQRVHNHNSFYVKGAMQGERLIDGRGFRCVSTPGPERKTRRITEDVRVAIAGAVGHVEADACCRLRSSAIRRGR